MRAPFCLSLLLLAGCDRPASPGEPSRETWRSGRDGLCVVQSGESLRAGLIVYGPGDVNCSATGTAIRSGSELTLSPRGDDQCRIPIRLERGAATLGRLTDECAYYCGPGADYSGRSLEKSQDAVPVTDLAGDPLC